MSDNMKTENFSSGLATVSILNSRFEWIEWDRAIRKQLKIAGYGDLLKDRPQTRQRPTYGKRNKREPALL